MDRESRVWFHALDEEVSMTPATVAERVDGQTAETTAIRPFRVDVPEADLIESETFKPGTLAGTPPQGNDAKCGFACHTRAKARDYVFTEYGKR